MTGCGASVLLGISGDGGEETAGTCGKALVLGMLMFVRVLAAVPPTHCCVRRVVRVQIRSEPPILLFRVAASWWPSSLLRHVLLVWAVLRLAPCVQQYELGGRSGFGGPGATCAALAAARRLVNSAIMVSNVTCVGAIASGAVTTALAAPW